MITLKKVNEDNYRKVLEIKMPDDQHFVAPNVYSLAQAWVFYEEARPFAIYNDDEVIGFMMLDWDEKEREAGVWRFMIALKHQGKGYGRKAMECAINLIKASNKFDNVFLDYVPENVVAKHLYESLGFVPTGEIEDGEIVMKLAL
ncbi:GNAT family N-acetyltransferase [Sedimentibacter sp. zth1]|uniref:GNAT family N-acetyltransferase n=1 Tax=Sedimentibacter sp. zth1 TaxID=2816908 RepID=UPI001A9379E2|nr:GNAT family N-acetyltransferase [Sedimentibacter sp. zth1]QSX05119.1 GNAT family N-acetyltransferase [Sedimentibacter sp. zth1]